MMKWNKLLYRLLWLIIPALVHVKGYSQTIKADNDKGVCPNGTVTLTVSPTYVGATYSYFRNGSAIARLDDHDPSNTVNDAGNYSVTIKTLAGVILNTPIYTVNQLSQPPASIDSPAGYFKQLCKGEVVVLQANTDPGIAYTWLRNNATIPNSSPGSLSVKDEGKYQVRTRDANNCFTYSPEFEVKYYPQVSITITPVPTICDINTAAITLSGTPAGGMFSGSGVSNGKFDPKVAGVGTHTITYQVGGSGQCPVIKDYTNINVSDPKATITPSIPGNILCVGQNVTLNAPTGYQRYEWSKNGNFLSNNNQVFTNTDGNYVLKVTDILNCINTSAPYNLSFVDKVNVTLDSIAGVCGTNNPVVTLNASPAGGQLSGAGVVGNTFDPKKAGIGIHMITYTVNSSLACQNGTARRWAVVENPPSILLPDQVNMPEGGSVVLNAGTSANAASFSWNPTIALSNPSIANPVASPFSTIDYELTVKSSQGCENKKKIKVFVYKKLDIPTAFNTSSDLAINKSWTLFGINSYPNAEIWVYNRWGTVVFYSKGFYTPFDGRSSSGAELPTGEYIYHILPNPEDVSFHFKGVVTIMR